MWTGMLLSTPSALRVALFELVGSELGLEVRAHIFYLRAAEDTLPVPLQLLLICKHKFHHLLLLPPETTLHDVLAQFLSHLLRHPQSLMMPTLSPPLLSPASLLSPSSPLALSLSYPSQGTLPPALSSYAPLKLSTSPAPLSVAAPLLSSSTPLLPVHPASTQTLVAAVLFLLSIFQVLL